MWYTSSMRFTRPYPRKRRHSAPKRIPLVGSDPPGIAYRDDIGETLPTTGTLSVAYRLTGIHWYKGDAIGQVYLGYESYWHAIRYREGRRAIRIVTRPALLLLAIAAFYLVFAVACWHDRRPLPGSYFDQHPLPGQHQIIHVPF